MSRQLAIFREAIASARSQPVASTLTVLVIAGMVLAIMLTTGRTVGAEQRVLASLDDLGTRTITIRAEDGAGITSNVLDRLGVLDDVEWVGAFTGAIDATNARVPDGTKVATRYVYAQNLALLRIPEPAPDPGDLAYASSTALRQLGLPELVGGITLMTGAQYGIGGELTVPDFLRGFEPLVLIPVPDPRGDEPVNIVVIVAASPNLVAAVSDAALSLLGAADTTKVTVETSETLAQLRAVIQNQLSTFSRGLVLALLAICGTIVAVILYGLVMMRRRDFGRRRALGASRLLIVNLVITQTAWLGLIGIAIGVAASIVALGVPAEPLPPATFILAVCILALVTALAAALVPAVAASRREPIRELRVP